LEETPVKAGKVSTETSSPTVRNYSGTPALRIAHPERHALLGHRSAVLWLTGLSGAGKSTLATALERRLVARGVLATVIDGDLLRSGLSRDLGYAPEDRRENLRRATELALHLSAAGLVVIVALISPSRADRSEVARRMKETGIPFAEVFINTPLTVCERRDRLRVSTRPTSRPCTPTSNCTRIWNPSISPLKNCSSMPAAFPTASGRRESSRFFWREIKTVGRHHSFP